MIVVALTVSVRIVPVRMVVVLAVSVGGTCEQRLDGAAHVERSHGRSVAVEVTAALVDPGLEAGHAVDEEVRVPALLPHARPRRPAVAVVADRDE
jgi:hypothetical protein